MKVEYHDVYKD